MSSIPTLKRHGNGVYYVHWTEGRRSLRVSTRAKSVDAAKAFLAEWLTLEREDKTEHGVLPTFNECWSQYTTAHPPPDESAIPLWAKNLKTHFGELTPDKITDEEAQKYLRLRQEGKIGRRSVPGSVRSELAMLCACLNWCSGRRTKRGRLKKSAALFPETVLHDIELPPPSPPRDRWLRTNEVKALLDAFVAERVNGKLSAVEIFTWIALETASRRTAIRQLTWDRVDFEIGTIDFNKPGRAITTKKRGTPPISAALSEVLTRAYAERTQNLVIDPACNINAVLKKVGTRAGVEGVTPHVLRHTAATHMARNSISLWKIAGVLANTAAVVERVYAKHTPDGLTDAVAAISKGSWTIAA